MQQIFDEYNAELEEGIEKYDFVQSVKDLMSGKMTAEQIVKQGGYDIYA